MRSSRLPVIAGLAWLLIVVTSESLDRHRNWRLVEARITDVSGDEHVTAVYTDQGQTVERKIPKASGLRSAAAGEMLPLHVNPANPGDVRPARWEDLWASSAILGLFLAALGGAFLVMWFHKPMKMELPPLPVPAPAKPSAFRRPEPPRTLSEQIVLRQAPSAWKANLVWAVFPAILAFFGVSGLMEGDWAGAPLTALGLAGTGWLVTQSIRNKNYVLRCGRETIEIDDRLSRRTLRVRDIAKVERVEINSRPDRFHSRERRGLSGQLDSIPPIVIYKCLDANGKLLLRLDKDMAPPHELARLLDRLGAPPGIE
jgi:hypothetical protein